jgi:PAS domain S-box-containing protein
MRDLRRTAEDLEGLRLDVVVRALPDGIFVLDSGLRVVYAGPPFWALFAHVGNRVRGQNLLTMFPERDRQTVRTHLADVRDGRSEPLLGVGYRADGSALEVEVRATVLDLHGKQFFIGAVRDVTERQRQAKQAAALAQAAASTAASDSIDTVLDAISECALAGTRALAAWVTLDNEDHVAASVGAAGVPDGFRDAWCRRPRWPPTARSSCTPWRRGGS